MAASRSRSLTRSHRNIALLLGRVEHGDADLIVTLFSDRLGKVSALARGARKSTKRFNGSLEPVHSLFVELEEQSERELLLLRDARIEVARIELLSRLSHLEAAGVALRWLKQGTPQRSPDPEIWNIIVRLLDRLNEPLLEGSAAVALSVAGLQLLGALGWGLEFERCVRCGRQCPANRPAFISTASGGLVCANCGGARLVLKAEQRQRFVAAARGQLALLAEDCATARALVDQSLASHAGRGQK